MSTLHLELKESILTCDDKLIISLRHHGTQVRDNIVKMARNVISVTNLESILLCEKQHMDILLIRQKDKITQTDKSQKYSFSASQQGNDKLF